MSHHLKPFEPFTDLMSFDPVRNVEDMLRAFRQPGQWRSDVPAIRLDIDETEQEYDIRADIPGVEKDDIKVEIDGNRVVISAERKQDTEKKRGNTVHSERHWGQQYRAFTLPNPVDDAKAEARYEHGVLKLTLPKKAGAGMHRLDIH
ncbi:Hsp20/alpha crystallin family protein [Massilia sp. TW-1]|uniref:Hsp20/alpha crystallin family protein n=1 Tax=Telluria antibiotica TaxID=2717319 RepID=A0ABX0P7V8_9BURK|nr:Hsp20/alpha crystallin family protein [Telluria antibiotica]NIA53006.1 Hsp20/alpha crystallin family protein [Telluria antibiotica]